MPGMNGIEFLEAFNSNGLYQTIPIIMVTTEADKANVVKALKLGVKNYILKPFTNVELVLKVNQCLGRS
jgi:DNA-binding response OmpR family regulator